jgi:Dickkopf-like protein
VRWAILLAPVALLACSQSELTKTMRDQGCAKNLDCAYGLECVDGAALADGGVASGRTCQFHSFGDCEGDGTQPGPDGQPQCLNSYRCRNGHCTVQCAGHKDCKEGEVCKVGLCSKGGNAVANCYENKDCPWPETCYYGQCVTRAPSMRCSTDLDCPSGNRCLNGVCQ